MTKIALGTLTVLALVGLPSLLGGEVIEVHKDKVYAEPTADSAVVYFVRPALMGKTVKTWAFVDEEPVGANKGRHYTFAKVSPGLHLFWAKAENTSALELKVNAGETYYLKQGIRMGGMKARVKLMAVDAEEGKKAMQKCKYTELTDEGRERGMEIVANKYETALNKARDGDDG